jgi:23S rRNA pseudouridine1911/1915/1917 synthase
VVGDPVYGDDHRARNVAPADRQRAAQLVRAAGRQLLHAAELHLRHPADGRPLVFRAPPPADFQAALGAARGDR